MRDQLRTAGGLSLAATALAASLALALPSGARADRPASAGGATGVFYDSPVEGLAYSTPTHSGFTNARGEFRYVPGETVTFSVGGLVLGSVAVTPQLGRVTEAHLVADVAGDPKKIADPRVTNLARFLQSLDRDGDVENGITITASAADAVARHAAGITFGVSEDAFAAEPEVAQLFSELGATLRTAAQARNQLRRSLLGIRKASNVHVPMRDGSYLLADVFVPVEDGGYPVVMSPTAYGKAFGSGCACSPAAALAKERAEDAYFEFVPGPGKAPPNGGRGEVLVTPNTVQWVPKGFAILRIDTRGTCNTPGVLWPYSAQEAFDNYDAIEWAAAQPWSNGNVGLWGLSYSASIQFNVASLKPPHLKAMIPDSNDPDQYRDIVYQGGIYYRDYRESWFYNNVAGRALRCLDQPFVDIVSIFHANPFADDRVYGPIAVDPATGAQLPTGQVSADLSQITIPVWTIERQDVWPIHVRGPSEVFLAIGSKKKRLTIEAGDEFTKAQMPETVELHQKFFDHWLGGKHDDGVDLPPPVTIDWRLPGGGWTTGYEKEWPLARTQYVRWYLDATNASGGGTMSLAPPAAERSTTYSADVYPEGTRLACSEYGVSFVSEPLAEDTAIGGYMKLGLSMSSTSADMDVFATLRVLDESGNEVFYNSLGSQRSPVSVGFLKASHRKEDPARSTIYRPWLTHLASDWQPLVPGEKVHGEVEIWPATAVLRKGFRLRLDVQPYDGCFAAAGGPNGVYLHGYDVATHAGASNTIYTGGIEPSYLQLPIVPAK